MTGDVADGTEDEGFEMETGGMTGTIKTKWELFKWVDSPCQPIPYCNSKPAPARDLSDAHIDASRTIVFGETRRQYTINGHVFDHSRIDTRVPLGNIEQWTIRNDTDEMHVFHIHQVNFQVMAINGQPQSFNGALDTVSVAPEQSVTLRIAFTQPEIVGRFMYHCHVLEHEDAGMMAQIEVYDPRHPKQSDGGQAMNMSSMSGGVKPPKMR
jgi:FtsP/CotA-like multicopper oxidase with cupredoxin domain